MTKLFRALDDPTRRRILELLRDSTLTVGEISKHFNMSLPSISYHIDLLKRADLVLADKRGQFVHLSLNTSVLDETVAWFTSLLSVDPTSRWQKSPHETAKNHSEQRPESPDHGPSIAGSPVILG